MNHKAKREAALSAAESITQRALDEGRALTADESAQFNNHLSDAQAAAHALRADKAREKYSSVLAPRVDDTATIGNWVEERVMNNATQAGFAPYAWRPSVVAALTGTSVAQAAGFTVEYLADGQGDRLYIPAITQNPSANLTYGTAALGTATASDPTIAAGAVQCDRVQALTIADNTILADAPARYFTELGNALVTSVSEKIDATIFAGGTFTTAIGSVSGIGTVSLGANGATLASAGVDPLLSAYGTAKQAGANPSVWVMNASVYTSLLKVKSLTSGSNTPLMFSNTLSSVAGAVPFTFLGLPILVTAGTTTIGNGETAGTATNTSSIYLLDSSKISLVYRTESAGGDPISLTADRSRYFVENQTAILATARVGLRVTQPAAVTRITGVIA